MIGHPKHVQKALEAGVDIICAQGGEGGGHTGSYIFHGNGLTSSVPTSILIPEVVALCHGKKSSLNGQPIYVVAAGAIYNGKSLAAALMYIVPG
jgi:NAD(P)H-dependent flavin oxidoreductase YrpB (nitropropane dioxygenase family)